MGSPGRNKVTLFSYTASAVRRISLEQLTANGGMEATAWDLPDGSTVDFGTVDVGQTVDRTVRVRNTGSDALNLGALMLNAPGFQVLQAPSQAPLPPGGWTDAVLRFNPLSPGLQLGSVRMVSDDPDQPEVILKLRGTARPNAAWPFGEEGIALEITVLSDGGGNSVRFQAVPGITYILQRSQDLITWDFSSHVTADETGAVRFTDSSPPAKGAFYRLKAR